MLKILGVKLLGHHSRESAHKSPRWRAANPAFPGRGGQSTWPPSLAEVGGSPKVRIKLTTHGLAEWLVGGHVYAAPILLYA